MRGEIDDERQLETGAMIGPYRVDRLIGTGGMGEVYRAWDPRLEREVALKLLPLDVVEDPARRRRFLDEARAAGGLNHPNILAVYDVSVGEGTPYIVSELLEGRQLRDEIDRGPVPTKRLLDLAVQMASGLRAAHDAGFAHRDLKPENVMVTRDGRVKILDFGLAKAYEATSGAVTELEAATMTAPGMIVGTPHYMSPEQAGGRVVDFRSDQFSLGLILYEMATGVHPFRKATAVQTMSAIVGDEARPIAELNAKIPTVLRWIIERCLAKDPADRYASTADLAKDLTTLHGRLAEVSGEEARPIRAPRRARLRLALAIGAGVALFVVAVAALAPATSDGPPPLKFTPLVTDAAFQGAPAWSPDGSTLAYMSAVDGILQIFTKSLASPLPHQVTDSRFDCTDPFWSPDGARIYYHSLARDARSLWSVSSAGGPPELVVENATNAAISRDGRTLAFFQEANLEQDLSGGGRRSIWFAAPTGADVRRYMAAPFDTRTVVEGALRFSPDGSRLLAWVWGWPDDTTRVPSPEFWVLPWPTGEPYKVLPSLASAAPAATSFDWLDTHRVVVSLWDAATTGMHLWIANIERGTSARLTSTPGSENRPAVAPGGQKVACASEAVDFDLVLVPLDGAPVRDLLVTSRNELDPTFATDGSQYAYVSDKGGVLQLWLRSRDGQFERPVVGTNQFPDDLTLTLGSPAFSPKGDRLAYQRYAERGAYQIWISTVAAAGPPVLLAPRSRSFYQDAPTWSPDGAWIAFIERTEENVSALVKARVGVSAPPEIIARGVVLLTRPKWSPDGRWIVHDTADGLAIVSPDGKQSRLISQDAWMAYAWGADSKRVYGLREGDRPGHYALAVVDIDTMEERIINPNLGVIPPASQPIRGLTLLGTEALVTSIASARSDIWVAEGLEPPQRTLLSRLWARD